MLGSSQIYGKTALPLVRIPHFLILLFLVLRESGIWYPSTLRFIPETSLVGGPGWNNQLVYYDIQSNSWHWPR